MQNRMTRRMQIIAAGAYFFEIGLMSGVSILKCRIQHDKTQIPFDIFCFLVLFTIFQFCQITKNHLHFMQLILLLLEMMVKQS